jgi:hypothetical protein
MRGADVSNLNSPKIQQMAFLYWVGPAAPGTGVEEISIQWLVIVRVG